MAAGYKVGVHNNSTGSITITRATGGDTINGSAKNITLGAQQRANFRVNAAANGYIMENANPLLMDSTDASKQAVFDLSGITTGTSRTLTLPDASGTVLTSGSVATQADQETASSTSLVVTSGRQHFHPGHPKCWARVNVTAGTPSLDANYNITSVTDTAIGRLTITIATDFSSANWCCIASGETANLAGDGGGAGTLFVISVDNGTIAAGSVVLECWNVTGFNVSSSLALNDPLSYSMVGYGDHA